MSNNKTAFDVQGSKLIMSRVFEAPRDLVFKMWSRCEHLKHWWGPKEWPMDECEMEFREGGEWRYCLRGPNEGDESWGLAIYREIKNPEKIVYKDHFTDSEGTINEEMPDMLITVEFIEQDDKTEVLSTTLFDSPGTLEKIVEMGAMEGWNSSLDRLEEYLASTL